MSLVLIKVGPTPIPNMRYGDTKVCTEISTLAKSIDAFDTARDLHALSPTPATTH